MKIAFYLDNRGIENIDFSLILNGNPGCAGTEYMFYLISTSLAVRNNNIEVTFLSPVKSNVDHRLNAACAKSTSAAIEYCSQNEIQLLIIKHDVRNIKDNSLNYKDKNVGIIIWCHVFMSFWELDYYYLNKNIKRVVNVGKEALDLYLDHPLYDKSDYIYNCVQLQDVSKYIQKNPIYKRENIITYIGQLSPFKGFHVLAKAWPKILENVPNAQLYVIGSGKLYDRNAKLGHLGLAEKSYEDKFISYLKDKDGKISRNVHFMGVMGDNKKEILSKTKVGVPNPSGITETFCISAVELQMYGAYVTTINAPGFIDTVKYGDLYKSPNQLADYIIRHLRDNDGQLQSYNYAIEFFDEQFSLDSVSSQWEGFINNGYVQNAKISINRGYRFKWLKSILSKKKYISPKLALKIPHLERVLLFIERLLRGKVTYLDSNCNV